MSSPSVRALWPSLLIPSLFHDYVGQLGTLAPAEWQWLVTQAKQHEVAPLLYNNLHAYRPAHTEVASAINDLRAAYKTSVLLALQREGEMRRIFDRLAQQSIRPVVFKGAALANTVYPTAACRPMGDIDLWVTHDEMPEAIRALTTLGYRFHEKQNRPHALTSATDGEVQMRPGVAGQSLVELHWGVFAGEWLARTSAVDRVGIRSRLVHTQLAGRDVYFLSPEDALIQLAVHAGINHQMSLHPLRSLVDIILLAGQGIDWDTLISRTRTWRVGSIVGYVLILADALFAVPYLRIPASALAPIALRRYFLRRFASPQAILDRTNLSASNSRFFYLLCATDRTRDSMRLFFRTLWPERSWLAARYGTSNLTVRARHLTSSMRGDI